MAKLTNQIINSLTYKVVKTLNEQRAENKRNFLDFNTFSKYCNDERDNDPVLDHLMGVLTFSEGSEAKNAKAFQTEAKSLKTSSLIKIPVPADVITSIREYLLEKNESRLGKIKWSPSKNSWRVPNIVHEIQAEIIEKNLESNGDMQKLVSSTIEKFDGE